MALVQFDGSYFEITEFGMRASGMSHVGGLSDAAPVPCSRPAGSLSVHHYHRYRQTDPVPRALILEETLLKKGFFQAIFPKLLKVLGKGFKGKNPFPKGFSP